MQSINVFVAVVVSDIVKNITGDGSEMMKTKDRTHKSRNDSLKTGLRLRLIPYRVAGRQRSIWHQKKTSKWRIV